SVLPSPARPTDPDRPRPAPSHASLTNESAPSLGFFIANVWRELGSIESDEHRRHLFLRLGRGAAWRFEDLGARLPQARAFATCRATAALASAERRKRIAVAPFKRSPVVGLIRTLSTCGRPSGGSAGRWPSAPLPRRGPADPGHYFPFGPRGSTVSGRQRKLRIAGEDSRIPLTGHE